MSGMGFQYTSVGGAIRTIIKQEGFAGLYKGIVPNLLKVAPSMAASWYTFETARDFLVWLDPQEPV
jgi:solute carrier family 25 phosphate transporter 23/24/25/41